MFVELQISEASSVLVNIDEVDHIYNRENGEAIVNLTSGEGFYVKNRYEDIKQFLMRESLIL